MAVDFTDLTDDEGGIPSSDNKKGKRPKEPKPSKAPKVKKLKVPKEPKPKKGKPTDSTTVGEKQGGRFLLLMVVLVLLISGTIAGSVVFNFFGFRDMLRNTLVNAVITLDPEFAGIEYNLRQRERRLDTWEQNLLQLEEMIAQLEGDLVNTAILPPPSEYTNFAELITGFVGEIIRIEQQLATRETQLDRRSASLDRREESMDTREAERLPLFRRNLTAQEIEDITSLARTYTQMSPEAAAGILSEVNDLQHVATILFFMTERHAGAILAAMEAELAAEITEILLGG